MNMTKDKYSLQTPMTAEEYDEVFKAFNRFGSPEQTFGDFIVSAIMYYITDMKAFAAQADASEKDCMWEASE